MSNNMSPFINTTIYKNGKLIDFITSIRISPEMGILNVDNKPPPPLPSPSSSFVYSHSLHHPFETTIRMSSYSLKSSYDDEEEDVPINNLHMLANAALNTALNATLNNH